MTLLGENNTKMLVLNTDADGKISLMFPVPTGINAIEDSQAFRVSVVQREVLPGYVISKNGLYILQGIYETLALALLATTLGALLALPICFLAARNLMGTNPLTYAIYVLVRTLLNIFRSIEALIIAIVFVVIVGLGPFPGMLALTVHTTAALGKLYSEVIEGIDSGPIEAIRCDRRQLAANRALCGGPPDRAVVYRIDHLPLGYQRPLIHHYRFRRRRRYRFLLVAMDRAGRLPGGQRGFYQHCDRGDHHGLLQRPPARTVELSYVHPETPHPFIPLDRLWGCHFCRLRVSIK